MVLLYAYPASSVRNITYPDDLNLMTGSDTRKRTVYSARKGTAATQAATDEIL